MKDSNLSDAGGGEWGVNCMGLGTRQEDLTNSKFNIFFLERGGYFSITLGSFTNWGLILLNPSQGDIAL